MHGRRHGTHGVDDRDRAAHRAAVAVDDDLDRLLAIIGLERHELLDEQLRRGVIYPTEEEYLAVHNSDGGGADKLVETFHRTSGRPSH